MQMYELVAHPAHPQKAIRRAAVALLAPHPHWFIWRWRVEGVRELRIAPFARPRRQDGLWRTTCFELFVQSRGGDGYTEFNFSPSRAWAAYDFDAPRVGMQERACPAPPVTTLRAGGDVLLFEAAIPARAMPPLPAQVGPTAVLHEGDDHLSYWAIRHPTPTKPDFHDPACFAMPVLPPV